ncbi:hypothetical protein KW843_17555 [Acidovorax sp. sif1233]|uniref:hypothetical protein n=1 Tax=Acidovorax sp. sif1233 TaxID=2854792 RepID=UPI001C43DCFE|nr:hypothetical protein [Acidovorax sp. sif1233]MBV7456291.1 hypothetical protein [Acidovorax sp. sif1233]
MQIAAVLILLVAPAAMAGFLLWRAYQLGIKHRVALTRQWISRPPEGIEGCARLFAWRDLSFAIALLASLGLLLSLPQYLPAWVLLMAFGSFVHQGFTGYAVAKLRKRPSR